MKSMAATRNAANVSAIEPCLPTPNCHDIPLGTEPAPPSSGQRSEATLFACRQSFGEEEIHRRGSMLVESRSARFGWPVSSRSRISCGIFFARRQNVWHLLKAGRKTTDESATMVKTSSPVRWTGSPLSCPALVNMRVDLLGIARVNDTARSGEVGSEKIPI